MRVEVLNGGGEEGNPLLQLLRQCVLDQPTETQDNPFKQLSQLEYNVFFRQMD